MMRIALPVIAALWLVSGWSELASSGSGNGVSGSPGFASSSPAVAADSSGNPTVAWSEDLGGGNTRLIRKPLPRGVRGVRNIAGVLGCIRLWHPPRGTRALRRRAHR